MTELLTAAQMRAIEQAAIAAGEVTGLELMERAGQGVVDAIFEEWPELAGKRGPAPAPPEYLEQDEGARRAVVLCGPGNNGGDGFVVARLLKERGWDVEVFLYGDPDKLPPDAKVNYERWRELSAVVPYNDEGEGAFALDPTRYRENTLLVDALFGTGLTRPVEKFNSFGWVTQITEWRLKEPLRKGGFPAPRVVSIDLPSGVCTDSGEILQSEKPPREFEEIRADLTVTFHRIKLAHAIANGPEQSGKVVVKPIGLEPGGGTKLGAVAKLAEPDVIRKRGGSHKYVHGHALVLSGGHGKTGAARLAARGALRIGAGLVTVGAPRAAMMENACQLTAIMLRQMDGADELRTLLQDSRFNAVCLGPGLGLAADREGLVLEVLQANRATVLDADALTQFEDRAEALFEVLHENCVITPHGGEFARLFPDLAEKLNAPATTGPAYSKVDATREAAKRAGCVVLFKGPDTVIAAPNGLCSVNSAHYDRSAPWLATAGSGDVLAGVITGLMARGLDPMQAAETAAYIHVECALNFGPGLIAEDLPEQIPAVLRKLDIF
ncbi:bifunctional ADP-dependent NAD(P)H-hydrate dehydratase/NAD(P)H-hydrate epimerase [Phaeobacter piscinae]|uniref:bifunctional ADP-dependent NAD(P)H-hydrate dehydratase/NAD(P)H-hydrate epimerase n=1 Tax=Phaeobacter piscinae TaxID=1580596 RepID=UPI00058AC2D8|nr:bifunctional ADP-dependent NAD(P)H-hydrate dehydratase/NAD(P)H-hydrate epimerase [Phaeobacter piscinae]UTS80797.1 Bifunctional NAD(P)H-hydrate repair enzyme Nnr [Phaeobacter piscinae]